MSTSSVNAPAPIQSPQTAATKAVARGADFVSLIGDATSDVLASAGQDEDLIDTKPAGEAPAPDSILAGLLGVAFAPSSAPVAGVSEAGAGAAATPAVTAAPAETAAPAAVKPAEDSLASALQAQAEPMKAGAPARSPALEEAKRALADAGVVSLTGESAEESPRLAAPGSQSAPRDEARASVVAAPQATGGAPHTDVAKPKAKKGEAARVEAAQTAALGAEAGRIDDAATQGGDAPRTAPEAKPADVARPEAVQPGQAPERLQTSAAPATPSAQSALTTPSLAASAAAQVANQIATHASSRRTRFEVQLDPGDLGRVDVRLDIQHDGRVATRLIVERPETLDLLRNDARELSRTLEQAGFQLGQGGLAFQLRDGRQNHSGDGSAAASGGAAGEDDIDERPQVAAVYGRGAADRVGLDIKA